MKAIGARQFFPTDDPECLVEFTAEMPVAGAKDLLVRVLAVAVNPVDTKVRKLLGETRQEPPRVLGFDAAGIVAAVGDEVVGFSVGDEVYYAGDVTRPGSNAEFQTVDARLVAKKPATWTFEEAAAVGTLGLIVETVNPLHIGNPFRLKSPRVVWEYMMTRSRFQTADMHRQGEILAEISRRCDAGNFPRIATRVFGKISAENLIEAHAAMENGSAHGKWVLSGW